MGSRHRAVGMKDLDGAVRQATRKWPNAGDLIELVPLRMWIVTRR